MKKCCLALAAIGLTATSLASGTDDFLSGNGYHLFLAYGLYHAFETSKEQGTRMADSILTTGILTEVLKRTTNVERPDHSDRQSFPSGHASAAFAVAAFQAQNHPKEAPFWYAGAALIGQSRVNLHRHHETDVLAGAVLGCFVSSSELRSKGFIIQPAPNGAMVADISIRF